MNQRTLSFFLLTAVSSGLLPAQIIIDNFDDDSRNPVLWITPQVWERTPELLEQNQRLELKAGIPSGPEFENLVSQSFKKTPSYDQFWQIEMIVSIDHTHFTQDGQIASLSIGIGNSSEGDEYVEFGYGTGREPGESDRQALFWYTEDETNPDGDSDAVFQVLPQAIALRVAYDPNQRLIRMFHDDDTDDDDGEWTEFAAFTIDGSDGSSLGASVLDWGMSGSDSFQIEINGSSTKAAVTAGSVWVNDFECTLGRTLLASTIDDDFDDNSRDDENWNTPDRWAGTTAQLLERNGRLEFSTGAGDENVILQGIKQAPPYNQPWQVEMLASVDKIQFSGGDEDGILAIVVSNPGSEGAEATIGLAGAVLEDGAPPIQAIFLEAGDASNPEALEDFIPNGIPQTVGLRVTYDPNLHALRFYYDLDPGPGEGDWTLYQAVTIDGTGDLDWDMDEFQSFQIHIRGQSNGSAVAAGSAWVDNFKFNLGSTARGEPGLRGFDDFNDDWRDPVWSEPESDSDTVFFKESNHRLEFTADPASGEHEIFQTLGGGFSPQFNQAFEIKTDVHCQPGATLGDDQGGVLEVILANDAGGEDLIFTVGSFKIPGESDGPLIAVSNNAVDPAPSLADAMIQGALPEIVGLRVTWDPESAILRCYTDTDGDRSVETWVLLADYTLDDGEGAQFQTDWGMADTDRFRIVMSGLAAGIPIAPGEAYYDNTEIMIEPTPGGYELWALEIPEESMRGPSDDASGNGIPNLLQYMYGLPALSIDTDVQLVARSEEGLLILTHGINSSATDYFFSYQENSSLTDNQWSDEASVAIDREFEADGRSFRELSLTTDSRRMFLRVRVVPFE